jgi:hypothetical protein
MPFHPEDGSAFFQLARTCIVQANLSLHLQIEEPGRMLGHYNRVEQLAHIIVRLQQLYPDDTVALLEWSNCARETLRRIVERLEQLHEYAYDIGNDDTAIYYPIIPEVQLGRISTAGRSRFSLPWQTISAYRKINYSWTKIAELLNISSKTLRRHRIVVAFQDPNPFSDISDQDLDILVRRLVAQTVGVIGTQLMESLVRDYGHRVPRHRIRACMSRVDGFGNLDRWATLIPRMQYSVAGPNCLWHIDGNLKLREYGFVLHGCIDGYSRRIIYLEANTNNRAVTVLRAFLRGVESVSVVPQRVRSDKGLENKDVALWMIMTNGENRGSFITGRSVHNQRIERLWRDVNRWLTPFRSTFSTLCQHGLYESTDPIDKSSLIFVYLPLLRRSIRQFIRVWNNHRMRTEHHRTPLQLYADRNPQSLLTQLNENELAQYGIDWEGPIPVANNDGDDEEGVSVEMPIIGLSDDDWEHLSQLYHEQLYPAIERPENNLISPDFNYAIDIYCQVQQWINFRLGNV